LNSSGENVARLRLALGETSSAVFYGGMLPPRVRLLPERDRTKDNGIIIERAA
jgi:hypothetical protein